MSRLDESVISRSRKKRKKTETERDGRSVILGVEIVNAAEARTPFNYFSRTASYSDGLWFALTHRTVAVMHQQRRHHKVTVNISSTEKPIVSTRNAKVYTARRSLFRSSNHFNTRVTERKARMDAQRKRNQEVQFR